MIKTKIALAVMTAALAFAPASAATQKKSATTSNTKNTKATKATSATKAASKTTNKNSSKNSKGKAVAAATTATTATAAVAQPAGSRQDRAFDSQSNQFLNALWRIDSESAIYAGKYDTAATLSIPDRASRLKELAFIDDWKQRFGKINARQLSPKQCTDLGGFNVAVLEQHQRRNTAYAVLGRGFLVFINVQLGNSQLAFVSLCDLVQNRRDHFARATPFSPVVDQYSAFSLENIGLKASVGDVFNKIAAHGSLRGGKQKRSTS